MAKLYFLNQEFEGASMWLDGLIEGDGEKGVGTKGIRLLYFDSWRWLHYNFFNCRDAFATETSTVVRTHLYNLVAALYGQFENLCKECHLKDAHLKNMIDELIEIANYSRTFPVSYWTYGDELSKSRLEERFSDLPSSQQIQRLLEMPCFMRMQYERMPYCYDNEEMANMRYCKEEQAYKKRLAGAEGATV
jgi:hypothetical protein